MKWTFEISDDELKAELQAHPRAAVENILARASYVPVREGRWGFYGDGLIAWEKVCPGITARIERIQTGGLTEQQRQYLHQLRGNPEIGDVAAAAGCSVDAVRKFRAENEK